MRFRWFHGVPPASERLQRLHKCAQRQERDALLRRAFQKAEALVQTAHIDAQDGHGVALAGQPHAYIRQQRLADSQILLDLRRLRLPGNRLVIGVAGVAHGAADVATTVTDFVAVGALRPALAAVWVAPRRGDLGVGQRAPDSLPVAALMAVAVEAAQRPRVEQAQLRRRQREGRQQRRRPAFGGCSRLALLRTAARAAQPGQGVRGLLAQRHEQPAGEAAWIPRARRLCPALSSNSLRPGRATQAAALAPASGLVAATEAAEPLIFLVMAEGSRSRSGERRPYSRRDYSSGGGRSGHRDRYRDVRQEGYREGDGGRYDRGDRYGASDGRRERHYRGYHDHGDRPDTRDYAGERYRPLAERRDAEDRYRRDDRHRRDDRYRRDDGYSRDHPSPDRREHRREGTRGHGDHRRPDGRAQRRGESRRSDSSGSACSFGSRVSFGADRAEDGVEESSEPLDEQQLLMKAMGFGEFSTTKNKQHLDSDLSGVAKRSRRQYRQLRLPDAVAAVLRLRVVVRVPVLVHQHHRRGHREVQPDAAGLGGDEQQRDAVVGAEALDHVRAQRGVVAAVEAQVGHVRLVEAQALLDEVEVHGELRKDQRLALGPFHPLDDLEELDHLHRGHELLLGDQVALEPGLGADERLQRAVHLEVAPGAQLLVHALERVLLEPLDLGGVVLDDLLQQVLLVVGPADEERVVADAAHAEDEGLDQKVVALPERVVPRAAVANAAHLGLRHLVLLSQRVAVLLDLGIHLFEVELALDAGHLAADDEGVLLRQLVHHGTLPPAEDEGRHKALERADRGLDAGVGGVGLHQRRQLGELRDGVLVVANEVLDGRGDPRLLEGFRHGELEQIPQLALLVLHGRAREQQAVPDVERPAEPAVCDSFTVFEGVRLVDDHVLELAEAPQQPHVLLGGHRGLEADGRRAVVLDDVVLEVGRPAPELLAPVVEHRGGHEDQRRALAAAGLRLEPRDEVTGVNRVLDVVEVAQENAGLRRLAQPHLVGEDAVCVLDRVQQGEPVDAALLVQLEVLELGGDVEVRQVGVAADEGGAAIGDGRPQLLVPFGLAAAHAG
ncbi:cyclophilin-RNA interacting protein [Babesia caballi]|uniref:Cyclophilin-RNA interacting protein n=1 Tax=Babesia caballi TaxID=5871 RepID=A0AAV4LPJ4_BABCB|nr:cyclophilin-RNA interacting protein [Babesia caballi]